MLPQVPKKDFAELLPLPEPAGAGHKDGLPAGRRNLLDSLGQILVLGVLLQPEAICNDHERFSQERGQADVEKALSLSTSPQVLGWMCAPSRAFGVMAVALH